MKHMFKTLVGIGAACLLTTLAACTFADGTEGAAYLPDAPATAGSSGNTGYIAAQRSSEAVSSGEDLKETADRIKLGSRHYAKRQLTWFRHMEEVEIVPAGPVASQIEFIIGRCELSKIK